MLIHARDAEIASWRDGQGRWLRQRLRNEDLLARISITKVVLGRHGPIGVPLILNPESIYRNLLDQERLALSALPDTHGIYALFDHAGAMRYVGITTKDRHGFHGRINNRHVGGSEERSHKFSHAYNTGRMWRARRDAGPDAMLAKELRRRFARRYCRATVLPLEEKLLSRLPALETAVQAAAPAGQLLWLFKRGFEPCAEPEELVNNLLAELRFTPEQRAAVDRQRARHAEATVPSPRR